MKYILAVFFPWLSLMLNRKFLAGIACLFLQATMIGWPLAVVWALLSLKKNAAVPVPPAAPNDSMTTVTAVPSYLARDSQEELMEELENLIVIDDVGGNKREVKKFLKEYKEIGLYLPPKVYARAMAHIEGREWLSEEEFQNSQG